MTCFLRFAAISLGLTLATTLHAQIVLDISLTVNGNSAGARLGFSVSDAGDVNNDGFDDFIVGAESGRAVVYSGADGSILYTFTGNSIGFSVSGAGDVNIDGFDDLIVGAPVDDTIATDAGLAHIYSGATGSILYTFFGDSTVDQFGYSVSGAGDVNNDGFADVIVGAWLDDNNGLNSGSARVLSGATGAILYIFNGDSAQDQFGRSVSGAGDVNNDGFADLIVGASRDDNTATDSGSARVFSGATGAILYTFNGDSSLDLFGFSVSGAGDVNNDGFDDLIVGALLDDNTAPDSGSARVFSGATGAILYTFNGDGSTDELGISVSGAGDVNADGFDDVIIGSRLDDNNGTSSGSARIHSGVNGSILFAFSGDSADDLFGTSVSMAGDVNNDGFADVIVGAPEDDNNGGNSGSARLFFKGYSFLPVPTPCPGDADLNGSITFADITAVLSNFGLVCP